MRPAETTCRCPLTHKVTPQDLKLTPLTLSLFHTQRSRGTLCGDLCLIRHSVPVKNNTVAITLYLRNLTSCPIPLFFLCPTALNQKEDFQGDTHSSHWALHCHLSYQVVDETTLLYFLILVTSRFLLRSKDKPELMTSPIFSPFSVVFSFFYFYFFYFILLRIEVLTVPFNTLLRKRPN